MLSVIPASIIILFWLSKVELVPRIAVDAYSICATVAYIFYSRSISCKSVGFLGISSVSLFQSIQSASLLPVFNYSLLPLFALANGKLPPLSKNINIVSLLSSVSIVFTALAIDLSLGLVSRDGRPSGPFTSSLHLAAFCLFASISSIRYLKRPSFAVLINIFILLIALASGSRAIVIAVLLILVYLLIEVFTHMGKKILQGLVILSPLLALASLCQGKMLSELSSSFSGPLAGRLAVDLSEADAVRVSAVQQYFSYISSSFENLLQFLFYGFGRFRYGAFGFAIQKDNNPVIGTDVIITESSVLMILFSLGVVLGVFLVLRLIFFFFKFFKSSGASPVKYVGFLALLFLFTSPLLDSIALNCVSFFMIKASTAIDRV